MEEQKQTQKPQANNGRLVLFPTPAQGHINPMLQLANILHSRGFSITLIHTHFNSPAQSNDRHFTFLPISDRLSLTEASMENLLSFPALLSSNCAAPFRDCLAGLLADGPIACLITDAIWHFSQSVADGFGIPRIVLRTDSQLESPVPEVAPLQVKDLPSITKNDSENLYKLLSNMVQQTKASSGLIWNTFLELEESALIQSREKFPVPNFPIGPFHKSSLASSSSLLTEDRSSISWLNTQKPKSVLYVSFGSIVDMGGNEFLEMAWGLANSMQPFLWVVRPGMIRGSEWLEALPGGLMEKVGNNGCIVKWAPQQEVLAHFAVGGFWTHNGWNSTLESICEGVPMICSPCFGDQLVNAKYVSDVWGIGLRFDKGVERGEVERGIRRVMLEKDGEEMREKILCLKEKVDGCLKEGGSSYQYLEQLITHILSFQ
ncbi:UDP-glycosyltransferase 76B1-like isoform X2 [Rhododendron vialii]|uniref:UDP-glycosyltransferase 76B1-like isoform X2 n=1 Tax=Rhododendron vialii TaxID=182163 RepID=UPI00265E61B7|nr:UDP-glycosyltransferase 76B1-like isoform X2 [Rhododendron vialii]